jgi:hypothetical protein
VKPRNAASRTFDRGVSPVVTIGPLPSKLGCCPIL